MQFFLRPEIQNLMANPQRTEMQGLAQRGDWFNMEQRLEQGQDINTSFSSGHTVLSTAALYGHVAMTRELLERGADIFAAECPAAFDLDKEKRYIVGPKEIAYFDTLQAAELILTALSKHEDTEQIKNHLNTCDQDGKTALFHVAHNEKLVRMMLKLGADPSINKAGGLTVLAQAVFHKDVGAVIALLEHGVPIDAQAKDIADRVGNTIMIQTLAVPSHNENDGTTSPQVETTVEFTSNPAETNALPADTACGADQNHLAMSRTMQWNNLRQEYLDSKLMETIDKDNHPAKEYERQEKYAYVRHLLERGADANLKNANGMSLLKLAAAHKMLPTVQLLLKAGADVSGFDKDSEGNHSALMNAIFDGNVSTVQKLIDGKADIHCISKNKETPLTYAATKSQFEVLKLLIDEGADIYATTQSQVFPGYVHAQTAEVISDALARNGTKDQAARYLNESHISGKPALFAAASNAEVMRMMLKSGADASIKAADGGTVLGQALTLGLVSSVAALLEHGVKVYDSTLRSVVLYGDKYTAKALLVNEKNIDDLIAGTGGNSIPLILCTNPYEGKDKRYIPYEYSERIERSNTKLSNGLESVIETVMGRLLDPDTNLEKSKQLEWKNIHQESVDSSLLSSIPDEFGDSLSTAINWIEKGADVNAAIESCGTTALMLTAKSSYLKTMQRLLNEKADINAVDNLGINTLMHATLNTQPHAPKMVGMLLENGADIYARTHFNETVIINAVKTNKISVLEKILKTATSSLISDNSTSYRNGLPPTDQENTTATTGVTNILHELIPLTTDEPLKSCDEILPTDKRSSKEFDFPEPFSHRNYGHGFKHFEKLSDADACMPGKPLGVSFGKIASSQQETARPWQAAYNSVFGVPAGKDAVLIHNAFKAQFGPNIHGMQAAHTAAVHPTTDNVWPHDTCLQIWGRDLAGHTTTAAAQPPFWGPVAAMGQAEPQAMDVLLTASVAQSTPPAQVSQAQAPGAEDEALMEAVVIGSMEWSGH